MITVGLTGVFGSGKSTVLSMFKRLGAVTLDSDAIVHEELKCNKALSKKIASLFGPDILKGGCVRRRILAALVFGNRLDLDRLNRLIHPLVKERIQKEITRLRLRERSRISAKKGAAGAVLVGEVPLLFEAGFNKIFDVTLVVAAGPRVQKERMLKNERFSVQDLKSRMRYQMPLDAKIKACDFVIDNNKEKKQTFTQVKELMESFRKGGKKWKSSK